MALPIIVGCCGWPEGCRPVYCLLMLEDALRFQGLLAQTAES